MTGAFRNRGVRRTALRAALCGAAACTAFAGLSVPAFAQDEIASATSVARIRGDTRITKLGDLEFGAIIPGNNGGTITIAVNSAVSTTGDVVSVGGGQQAASFNITRQILRDYPSYQGPNGTDTIQLVNLGDPTATMTLRDFTTDFNRTIFFGLPAYFFQTSFDFRIGGTLDVAADQEPGQYRGFFTVNIEYN